MTDWTGRHVIRGVAEELMDRLPRGRGLRPPASRLGLPGRGHGRVLDPAHGGLPRHRHLVADHRSRGAQDRVHGHGARGRVRLAAARLGGRARSLEGPVVKGAIFESKEGRQAIRAKAVVDATGDADLFARAGAAFDSDIDEGDIHHCINTAWLFGGVDMDRWIAFRTGDPKGFSDFMARGREQLKFFEKPFVVVAQRRGALHGPAAVRLQRRRRRGPHRGRAALAPADGRPPRGLPRARAGLRATRS